MTHPLPTCPACGQIVHTDQMAVMHTSELFGCPKEWICRWLHSKCAYQRGISIPDEDKARIELEDETDKRVVVMSIEQFDPTAVLNHPTTEYQPGKAMHFYEDGCVFKVQLLKGPYPDPQHGGESFDLKILEVLQMNGVYKQPNAGEVFTAWRATDAGPYAGWSLREIT
jgi:hypothetical protein